MTLAPVVGKIVHVPWRHRARCTDDDGIVHEVSFVLRANAEMFPQMTGCFALCRGRDNGMYSTDAAVTSCVYCVSWHNWNPSSVNALDGARYPWWFTEKT